MKSSFFLFLHNQGDAASGNYRCLTLLPLSHKKGSTLWLPYDLIIDMTKAMLLKERRNFQRTFASAVEKRFGLVIDTQHLKELPLVDVWQPYRGQVVKKEYRADKCFHLSPKSESGPHIRKVALAKSSYFEWEFQAEDLIGFYSDARFQGFLYNAGFSCSSDQLQLTLSA